MKILAGPPALDPKRSLSAVWPALLFAMTFAALAVASLVQDSTTYDETVYVAAGLSHLQRGDFRMCPEHPPLAKLWVGLPTLLATNRRPDYDSDAWRQGDAWTFGFEFLNGPATDPVRRNPADALLPARLAMVGLGLLLGGVVFAWTLELWGRRAALTALFLYCLSPAILAHARLATTDLPAAYGFTTTLWLFWRFLRRPIWPRALACGVALGLALAAKFSMLVLGPLLAILAVAWCVRPGEDRKRRVAAAARGLAIAGLAAWGILWAIYGFRFRATSDPAYALDWDRGGRKSKLSRRLIHAARDARLLPEAYLYGLEMTFSGQQRGGYLNGETSSRGWWYYFPEAFALKTTPALLLLLAGSALFGLRRTRGRSFDGWFVALPPILYLTLTMTGGWNIGHRYLLPVYPMLFIGAAGVVRTIETSRRAALAIVALLLGHAASGLLAYPNYLAYFNVFAAGREGGARYLVDSNLDWGQDLLRLKARMAADDLKEVHLAYFGTADPRAYGIAYRKTWMSFDARPDEPYATPESGDVVAISVTLLKGLYYDMDADFARRAIRLGASTPDDLTAWRASNKERSRAGLPFVHFAEWAAAEGRLAPEAKADIEPRLFSHLVERLRSLEPFDRAGESIRLYRIP